VTSAVLTEQDFLAHVGKTLIPSGQHIDLTLVSVKLTEWPGWDDGQRKPFTLILRGSSHDVLPEGLYDVSVEEGPTFALYIIPIHTVARDRQDYQVVFN
jgi:hypothetical protein